MAYSDIALLAVDTDFMNRTRACAATEGIDSPVQWQADNMWAMAATPGFGNRYASALVNGISRPGNDQSVISDGDILSAVQAIESPEATEGAPEAPEGEESPPV